MSFAVQISAQTTDAVERRYGIERGADGEPSRRDFIDGPLAAAILRFSSFDTLPEAMGPSVRQCHVLVPGFTPVVFVGVLVGAEAVEIAGFADDPDYWDLIANDPGA